MRLAIIPARGGSKRIPKKNIKNFLGKPLIAYSIEVAIKSGLFDKVVVSTDSKEIAEVAMIYGAEVPFFRPAELSDDYVGTGLVVAHTIQWFIDHHLEFSEICCIYATAPLLQEKYLKQGLAALLQPNVEFSFSVCEFSYPIFRGFKITKENRIEMLFPEHAHTRSQDLEKAYHDAGQFYWGKQNAFLKLLSALRAYSVPIVLPHYLVQDIDSEDDWCRAELLYQALHPKKIERENQEKGVELHDR